jgi:hypothetical protein
MRKPIDTVDFCPSCLVLLGRCTGASSLYSPNKGYILCVSCFENENELIDEKGTNDIPQEVARYERNIQERSNFVLNGCRKI